MTILKEGTMKTYIYECGECGCVFTGDTLSDIHKSEEG